MRDFFETDRGKTGVFSSAGALGFCRERPDVIEMTVRDPSGSKYFIIRAGVGINGEPYLELREAHKDFGWEHGFMPTEDEVTAKNDRDNYMKGLRDARAELDKLIKGNGGW